MKWQLLCKPQIMMFEKLYACVYVHYTVATTELNQISNAL